VEPSSATFGSDRRRRQPGDTGTAPRFGSPNRLCQREVLDGAKSRIDCPRTASATGPSGPTTEVERPNRDISDKITLLLAGASTTDLSGRGPGTVPDDSYREPLSVQKVPIRFGRVAGMTNEMFPGIISAEVHRRGGGPSPEPSCRTGRNLDAASLRLRRFAGRSDSPPPRGRSGPRHPEHLLRAQIASEDD
jgi:hypothetical protein